MITLASLALRMSFCGSWELYSRGLSPSTDNFASYAGFIGIIATQRRKGKPYMLTVIDITKGRRRVPGKEKWRGGSPPFDGPGSIDRPVSVPDNYIICESGKLSFALSH